MSAWGATKAKAEFSAMLDTVLRDGPQLVTRRKQEFYVLTKEQLAERKSSIEATAEPFVSGWDALRPTSGEFFDVDFPRSRSKSRRVKFRDTCWIQT